MKPADLVLRCYGYEHKDSSWYPVCIDLNIDAEGSNEVKRQLSSAILGYLETVAEVETSVMIAQSRVIVPIALHLVVS